MQEGTAQELDIPMYQVDALVRRSPSLQLTRDGLADEPANGQGATDGRKIV